MSALTSTTSSMVLDNPATTSGVAASMHAPTTPQTSTKPSIKAIKRNRTEAGLDNNPNVYDNSSPIVIPPDLDVTDTSRTIITAPLRNRRFAIDGVHPCVAFFLLNPTGHKLWLSAPNNENALCAYIPGMKFPEDGDPSLYVCIIRDTAIYITQNTDIDVYPATPDHPTLGQGALYVICYIVNLTEEDKTTLLTYPLFCTPKGTIATFELDFDPNPFVGTWGRSCLTDNPTHVLALQETVRTLILQPGSIIFRALHRMNDRIPTEHNTSPTRRAEFIASTVEIIPINLKRRQLDGSHTIFTCFNLFIESPTYNHTHFSQWLDIIGKLTFRTIWGTVQPVEPFFCAHCGSRAHPSGLCAYLTDVAGFQARSITNDDHHTTTTNPHRGGYRGRGRGRARGSNRGRGYTRGHAH